MQDFGHIIFASALCICLPVDKSIIKNFLNCLNWIIQIESKCNHESRPVPPRGTSCSTGLERPISFFLLAGIVPLGYPVPRHWNSVRKDICEGPRHSLSKPVYAMSTIGHQRPDEVMTPLIPQSPYLQLVLKERPSSTKYIKPCMRFFFVCLFTIWGFGIFLHWY